MTELRLPPVSARAVRDAREERAARLGRRAELVRGRRCEVPFKQCGWKGPLLALEDGRASCPRCGNVT